MQDITLRNCNAKDIEKYRNQTTADSYTKAAIESFSSFVEDPDSYWF